MSSTPEEKAAWRARLRVQRDALTPGQRRAGSERIRSRILDLAAVRAARTVFCFVSRGAEVETHALIDTLATGGCRILVPKISGAADMVAVEFPGWPALQPGVLGILAPVSEQPFAGRIDVVITPGLGFTAKGDRLGMGRGYYDRWFAGHAYGLSIAICFECQLVRALPVSATDIPVDLIVTEERVLEAEATR